MNFINIKKNGNKGGRKNREMNNSAIYLKKGNHKKIIL